MQEVSILPEPPECEASIDKHGCCYLLPFIRHLARVLFEFSFELLCEVLKDTLGPLTPRHHLPLVEMNQLVPLSVEMVIFDHFVVAQVHDQVLHITLSQIAFELRDRMNSQ